MLRNRSPFAFAGLWEHWESKDGQAIDSCPILTTEPNDLLAQVHNRMPVILDPKDYEQWLDPEGQQVYRLTRFEYTTDLSFEPLAPDQLEKPGCSGFLHLRTAFAQR